MKTLKHVLPAVALLVAGATTTHAQFSLVSASLKPAGIFIPNSGTNHQYRLEDCRLEPLAAAAMPGTNRFQLTATLSRVHTDASSSGPNLRVALAPGYPIGHCDVKWTEDEISSGYRLQTASNLPAPIWQGVAVQANGSSRIISYPSTQVSTQKTLFFRLVKP